MANTVTLGLSPIIVDTAATDILVSRPIKIKVIRWVGATTAAHTAVIKDASGNIIWASHATANNHTEESVINEWFKGLSVTTLASGKLYIYYE